VAYNILSIIIAIFFPYIQKCVSVHMHQAKEMPDNGEVNRSLQIPVCPKSNANDLKEIFLLNIHAITVYPLQNRLLMIEYSDSRVTATLHSSGGSLLLRCSSKPLSRLLGRLQLSQNDVL
jgi:hypothetical protein